MFKVHNLLRYSLILAGFLHLQLGDWLPPYIRYAGDLLLMTIFLIVLMAFKSYTQSKVERIGQIIAITFFMINILYIIYSFISWGELLLIIRLARQPLLSTMYLYTILKLYAINYKEIRDNRFEFIFLSFLAINALFVGLKIYWPAYSEEAELFQGLLVRKIFVKGSVALYLLPILVVGKSKKDYSYILYNFLVLFYFFIIAIYILPFRSWFIVITIAFIVQSLIYLFHQTNSFIKYIKVLAIIILYSYIIIAIIFIFPISNTLKNWLNSLIIDIIGSSGTFEYRLIRDWSRVAMQLEDHWIYILFGYGFIHPESFAATYKGFSTETNDVGIVQFLLTYGFLGTLFFFIFWLYWIYMYVKTFFITSIQSFLKIAFVLIVMFGTLLSSNFFLWETFFVPIFFAIGVLLNSVSKEYYIWLCKTNCIQYSNSKIKSS